jgi:hypothetical protein
MANTSPTPASLIRILTLCVLALVNPGEFSRLEAEDAKVLSAAERPESEPPVVKVRRTFLTALLWTVVAMLVGAAAGFAITSIVVNRKAWLTVSAGVGALLLLWATFAVRGWDIQTFGGVTLSERVNRWLFRGLSWLGTVFLTIAAVLGLWE